MSFSPTLALWCWNWWRAARLAGEVSLYTWISIIGVILAGISLGSTQAARCADRWANRTVLAWLVCPVGPGQRQRHRLD
ncbi:MAG: hypothetical protein U0401_19370 [Anaerolineae bacterium]